MYDPPPRRKWKLNDCWNRSAQMYTACKWSMNVAPGLDENARHVLSCLPSAVFVTGSHCQVFSTSSGLFRHRFGSTPQTWGGLWFCFLVFVTYPHPPQPSRQCESGKRFFVFHFCIVDYAGARKGSYTSPCASTTHSIRASLLAKATTTTL